MGESRVDSSASMLTTEPGEYACPVMVSHDVIRFLARLGHEMVWTDGCKGVSRPAASEAEARSV